MQAQFAREQAPRISDRAWLALLIGLALVRGVLYATLVPPWQAPDETGHFEHAWLVARLGRIPSSQDANPQLEREMIASLYEWRYGDYIGRPLPSHMPDRLADLPPQIFASRSRTLGVRFSQAYLWSAAWIWPVQHEDLLVTLYLARFSSVVLNALILAAAWRLFHLLLPEQPALARGMTLVLAFHPQHTFINAMVGDGPLAELGAILALYGWSRILVEGWRWSALGLALGGTALGVAAKGTALFLVPLALVALLFAFPVGFRQRSARTLLGGLVGLALLLLLGQWLPSAPGFRLWKILFNAWHAGELAINGNGPLPFDQRVKIGVESYWFKLGWMNVSAPRGWYLLFWVAMLWALEGWLLPRSQGPRTPRRAIVLMAVAAGLSVGGWLAFLATPRGAAFYQGRYLFPAAAPITFLLVGGWARALPERAQARFPAFVAAAMAALDAVAFFPVVLSYFYGR